MRAGDTAQKLQPLIPAKLIPLEDPVKNAETDALDAKTPSANFSNPKMAAALAPAPMEGLTETLNGKTLPIARIQDDMTPFMAYRKPFSPIAGRALVSIVVVDFGLSGKVAQSILDNMPDNVTLAMTPYAPDITKWATSARAYGHEFWLTLPMKTTIGDSGPYTLAPAQSVDENQKRVTAVLGAVIGYTGLITEKDHLFTPEHAANGPILNQIFGRGLAIAESNPDIPAFGLSAALESGYPYMQNNYWLDADLRPAAIDMALQELEAQATRKGKAIAFIHPYPLVINKVQEWAATLDEKAIQLAPLSAMAQ